MAVRISGVFPALATPFVKGEVALGALASNIDKYNRSGLAGYLALGSTGESVLMNERERLQVLETVRAAAPDRTLIAGTGMQSTRATIEFTGLAADAGADVALVVTPFYYKSQMTSEILQAYYREVAEASRIPLLLYNVPKFTGIDLPLDAIASLAEHPNIVGLKESSGSVAFLGEVLRACPEDFAVFQGMGSVLFPSLAIGASGGILALSDMAPAETVEIRDLLLEGEHLKAREVQKKVLPLNQYIFGRYGIPGLKAALDLLGYVGGDPRPPLKPVSTETKDRIRQILEKAGVI
ncbi:MAG: dihydrodipicolinate synthase family protein [Deltaproteobacteria bacterium]|nr:dihydrodipicolinate synthase family protein [Deltaproteobacteria bacterium]